MKIPRILALTVLASTVFPARPLCAQTTNALLFSKASINISMQQGFNPPPQTIQVLASQVNVAYSALPTLPAPLLGKVNVAQSEANTPSTFTVFFALQNLPAGHYEGKITVTASNVTNPTTDIPVVIDVSQGPALTITPNPVAITVLKDSAASAFPVTVSSNGDAVNFTIGTTGASGANTWVSSAQTAGVTGSANNVTLNINPANLAVGTYAGALTITPVGANTPITVPINLTVTAQAALSVDTTSLSFAYQTGTAAPPAQTVNVSNPSGAQLAYTTTISTPGTALNWLKAPANGTAPGPLAISIDPTGLVPGTYLGTITLNATGLSNVTASIQVSLLVSVTPLLSVSPVSLSFDTLFQTNPQPKQLRVFSTSGSIPFSITVASGTDWLFLGTNGPATPEGAVVTIAPSALGKATGTLNSQLTIAPVAGAGTAGQTLQVPVTMRIAQVTSLQATPASVTFDLPPGTAALQQKDVTISSSDPNGTQFTISVTPDSARQWLLTSIASGTVSSTAPVVMKVVISPGSLTLSRYDATVTLTPVAPSNALPLQIPVTVRLTGSATFAISPVGPLSFTAQPKSPPQTAVVRLTSDPASTDFVTQSSNPEWLSVTPQFGNTGATGQDLTVRIDPANLTAGVFSGVINILPASNTTATPFQIKVNVTVGTPPTLAVSPANLTFQYFRGQAAPPLQTIAVSSAGAAANFTIAQNTNNGGSAWLSASADGLVTPTTVRVKVDPTGLAPGTYTGAVTMTGSNTANGPQTVGVTLTVQDIPAPVITDVQNGASFLTTAAAPGLIITIKGSNLGPAAGLSIDPSSGIFPTSASNTRVLFDSALAAPLLYVSANQINAIVPYQVFGRFSTSVQVERLGALSNPVVLAVKDAQPGLFTYPTGSSQAAILNENNSINSASNPAERGSIIQIFATGEGQTSPAGIDGKIIGADLRKPITTPVVVRIAGQNATVTYYGSAPGLVSGALQVNARIPATAGVGPQSIELQIGNSVSQPSAIVSVK